MATRVILEQKREERGSIPFPELNSGDYITGKDGVERVVLLYQDDSSFVDVLTGIVYDTDQIEETIKDVEIIKYLKISYEV